MNRNDFVPGQGNTICDITGFKVKTGEVYKTWDGLYVIDEAFSYRHPQDFPPKILDAKVFENTRFQEETAEAATAPEVI
jgi:hypothetical protein